MRAVRAALGSDEDHESEEADLMKGWMDRPAQQDTALEAT